MNNWKVIFATIIIFGAGVLTGGLLVDYVKKAHPQMLPRKAPAKPATSNRPPEQVTRPRIPEMLSNDFLGRLDKAVRLTAEQRDAIGKIIAAGQEQNREIWATNSIQMRKVIQETRQNIRERLQPAQQQLFEDLLKQQRPPQRPGTNAAPAVVRPALTNAVAR